MKKAAFIVIILLIIGGWWYASRQTSTTTVTNDTTIASGHPDPANATFIIDDTKVTLKNGSAVTPTSTDIPRETELTKYVAYGDLNGDKKEDAAFIIVSSDAVSGALNSYVAAYISGPVGYKATNTIPVGVQVSPEAVSINNGIITVSYLDRKPDDPLAAEPTVSTTSSYRYNTVTDSLEEK